MDFKQKIIIMAAGTAVAASALTAAAYDAVASNLYDNANPASSQSSQSGGLWTVSSRLPGDNTDFITAAERTVGGVVSVKNYQRRRSQQGSWGMDPFEFFFGTPRQQAPQRGQRDDDGDLTEAGLGSGVIISEDGYIVTNNHVVDGAEKVEVTLNDNRNFTARVVGTDETTDIALLKIDANSLPFITMGDSDNLRVGEWVLAVGNPFGFTSTVTAGIVSAKARNIPSGSGSGRMGIESYIQTDASVNQGNSGGALVNLAGELVGINTAIYSRSGENNGISFAIPTSMIKKVTSDIREFGKVQRAMLGISIADLTPELAKEEDITAITQGVYVGKVEDRSSALEAGLKKGDVITAINGHATNNMAQLQGEMAKFRPGDKVEVTYYRDNKKYKVSVKLLNNQGTTAMTRRSGVEDLGVAFKKANAEQLSQLGLSSGVEVSAVDKGRFADAAVKRGFIIYAVNDQRVATPDDIEKIYDSIMKSSDPDKVMYLRGYYPNGKRGYYAVDLAPESSEK